MLRGTVMITQRVSLRIHRKVKYKNGPKFSSFISANRPFRNRALFHFHHYFRHSFLKRKSSEGVAVHRLDSSQVSKRWTGCVEVASSYSGTKTFADYSLTTDLVFSHLLEFSWNPIIWFSDGPQYGFRDAGFALCEGRDSGLKVCTECEMPKICIAIWRDCAKIWFGMTGLENPIGDPPPGRSRQRTLSLTPLLGSLNNDDSDGNENGKKAIGLD